MKGATGKNHIKNSVYGYFTVTLALVMIALTGVILVGQNISAQRAALESRAFQVMTGILEQYSTAEAFDPIKWDNVTGFGVYDTDGNSLYRYGTAPALLDTSLFDSGFLSMDGSTVALIRKTGFVPGPDGPGFIRGRRAMHPGSQERNPRPSRSAPMHRGPVHMRNIHTAFLEMDASLLRRRAYWETGAVGAVFLALLGAVLLVFRYSRTLSIYREREQKNAYLVQLGEAARTLAHEIKNPLGVIRVQCATLERILPEGYHQNLSVITEETDRLASLTDRLRDFLNNGGGNPRSVGVHALLARFQERYGQTLAVVHDDVPDCTVFVDPDGIAQMIDNLVANARDALGETSGIPELVCTYDGRMVAFRVLDRGSGVPAEKRDQLFELFFTTKAQGTGIGLALVKRMAEMSGGTAGYRDRPGGGSEFWIQLPAEQKRNGDDA